MITFVDEINFDQHYIMVINGRSFLGKFRDHDDSKIFGTMNGQLSSFFLDREFGPPVEVVISRVFGEDDDRWKLANTHAYWISPQQNWLENVLNFVLSHYPTIEFQSKDADLLRARNSSV